MNLVSFFGDFEVGSVRRPEPDNYFCPALGLYSVQGNEFAIILKYKLNTHI